MVVKICTHELKKKTTPYIFTFINLFNANVYGAFIHYFPITFLESHIKHGCMNIKR